MAVEKEQQEFRKWILGMMAIAAYQREPIAFLGYLHLLAQRQEYNLAQAKQAYLDFMSQELTPEYAKRAPQWPEVRAYLLQEKAVTDWKEQSNAES